MSAPLLASKCWLLLFVMELEKLYGLETTIDLIEEAKNIDEPHYTRHRVIIRRLIDMIIRYRQFFLDATNEDFLVDLKNLCEQYPNEPVLNLFESHLSALKLAEAVQK